MRQRGNPSRIFSKPKFRTFWTDFDLTIFLFLAVSFFRFDIDDFDPLVKWTEKVKVQIIRIRAGGIEVSEFPCDGHGQTARANANGRGERCVSLRFCGTYN